MIRLKHLQTFHGPSPYSRNPLIAVLFGADAGQLPALRENLKVLSGHLPFGHKDEGGGAEFAGEDVARSMLALAALILRRLGGTIDDYQIAREGENLIVAAGYYEPAVSLRALQLAARLINDAPTLSGQQIERLLGPFFQQSKRFHPDFQAEILMDFARQRDLPYFRYVEGTRIWQFGWGRRSKTFFESLSNADGAIANMLAVDKVSNKATFAAFGAPAPRHLLADNVDDAVKAAAAIGYPCAVKPTDRGGGKGVSADVRDEAELREAFALAQSFTTGPVMIEKRVEGDEHRIMVVDGQFACAVRRRPSAVTGDGSSTIEELIGRLNIDRSPNPALGTPRPARIDDALRQHLAKQGHELTSVLPAGTVVPLRSNSNLATGGLAKDVTERVHPELRLMVEQLARSIGFGIAGLDYISPDISASPWQSGGAFIEMNTVPGLDACTAGQVPLDGILERAFGDIGRIPAELVITRPGGAEIDPADAGDDGSAVVAGNDLQIAGCRYRLAATEGWSAVHAALRNRDVQSLVIRADRNEIVSRGLPLDRFDRIVIADPEFPGSWLPLLRSCSAEVEILAA